MIPMISLDWMSPVIALMSVELSEKTLSAENSREITKNSAVRITTASAMRGDPMKLWFIDPCTGDSRLCPENTHPKPAFPLSLSLAAFFLHVINSPSYSLSFSCRDHL